MKYNENSWRVELHNHLDGSLRPKTIIEFAELRGIKLPSSSNAETFAEFARMKEPGTLKEFLKNFPLWTDVIAGDRKAIYQVAHDFVEDCACQKVAYVESRLNPMLLAKGNVSEEEVLSIVIEGFKAAEEKFGTKCNAIVTLLRGVPEDARRTFEIVKQYIGKGVVGIDVAGTPEREEMAFVNDEAITDEIVEIFKEAAQLGINRTVHAGEDGPPSGIEKAVYELGAQRIGHGYKVLQDMALYDRLKMENIHFETCPSSSILTGGADPDWNIHPVRQFCKDKVNYSINTDDILITGKNLSQEYDVCRVNLGLDAGEIVRCNFNAAKSSFLNATEKEELLNHMRKVLNATLS